MQLAMIILVLKENEQDQNYIFQCIEFESSQLHQLVIMYLFEQTSHGIPLSFLFGISSKLFFHTYNL